MTVPLPMFETTPGAIRAEARHNTFRVRAALAGQPDPGPYAGPRAVTSRPKAPETARERVLSMEEARARLGLPNAPQETRARVGVRKAPPRGATGRPRSAREPSAEVRRIVARAIDSGEWFSVPSLREAHMLTASERQHVSALVAVGCGDGLLEARLAEGESFSEFRRARR